MSAHKWVGDSYDMICTECHESICDVGDESPCIFYTCNECGAPWTKAHMGTCPKNSYPLLRCSVHGLTNPFSDSTRLGDACFMCVHEWDMETGRMKYVGPRSARRDSNSHGSDPKSDGQPLAHTPKEA